MRDGSGSTSPAGSTPLLWAERAEASRSKLALRHPGEGRRTVLEQPSGFRLRLLAGPALTPIAPGLEKHRLIGLPLFEAGELIARGELSAHARPSTIGPTAAEAAPAALVVVMTHEIISPLSRAASTRIGHLIQSNAGSQAANPITLTNQNANAFGHGKSRH